MNLYQGAAGIDHLERMAGGNSPVHRLHPGAKITVTLVYVITLVSFPGESVSALAAFVFYPAILMPLSGLGWRPFLARLAIALPFVFVGGLSNLILFRDTALYLGDLAVSRGLVSFVSIMLKGALSVFAVLLLMAATPFTEICRQLTRMGMPRIAALQLVMTYRYISVLIHEAASMFTAYTLRSPASGAVQWQDMGPFLGRLLLRSFDRAGRVYEAMKCRGFDGVYRTAAPRPFGPADLAFTGLLCGAIIGLRFFNLGLFIGQMLGSAG